MAVIKTIENGSSSFYTEIFGDNYLFSNVTGDVNINDIVASLSNFDRKVIELTLLYAALDDNDIASGFTSLGRAEYFAKLEKMAGENDRLKGMLMHATGFISDYACWLHAYRKGIRVFQFDNSVERYAKVGFRNKFVIILEEFFFGVIEEKYNKLERWMSMKK